MLRHVATQTIIQLLKINVVRHEKNLPPSYIMRSRNELIKRGKCRPVNCFKCILKRPHYPAHPSLRERHSGNELVPRARDGRGLQF